MEQQNDYMKYFLAVFERMERQGPGSRDTTLQILGQIPTDFRIQQILEVGCGRGQTALVLAQETGAAVTAVDNHPPFLADLAAAVLAQGLEKQVTPVNADMAQMPFGGRRFDLIWSEGAAYNMGVENALVQWRPFLRETGYLFISDAVWMTDTPSKACGRFWENEYPGMTDIVGRKAQAENAGYEVVAVSTLSFSDWQLFYRDMEKSIESAAADLGWHKAFDDLKNEIRIGTAYADEVKYGCFLLKKM